jgi:hypothetical protein
MVSSLVEPTAIAGNAIRRVEAQAGEQVAALYRHFGLALDPDVADRIGRLVKAKPNGGYGACRCSVEEYGLDVSLERERYARYMAHFGIRPEPSRRSSRSANSSPLLASR